MQINLGQLNSESSRCKQAEAGEVFGDKPAIAFCQIQPNQSNQSKMMSSCEPSPAGTPSVCISDVTLSTMMTEGDNDNDTVTSLDQFPGEYTPVQWTNSKKLKTPTPSFPRTFDSNVSSVTCMKYANLQDSTQRESVTPLRDLMPPEQEVPYEACQPATNETGANKENDSPPTVKVISPATAFRMKKAVFETKAQAYKSPNRKQRARHVSLFDSSPKSTDEQSNDGLSSSPNSAIVTETGDDCQSVTVTATAEVLPTVLETKPLTPNSKQIDSLEGVVDVDVTDLNKQELQKEPEMEQQEGVLLAKEPETTVAECEQISVMTMPQAELEILPAVHSEASSVPSSPVTPSGSFSVWKAAVLIVAFLALTMGVNRALFVLSPVSNPVNHTADIHTAHTFSELEVYEEPVIEFTEAVPAESDNILQETYSDEIVTAAVTNQLAIDAAPKLSFLRDVEELGTALSVLLQHHYHTAVSTYETRHGPAVRSAITTLRTRMQPLTAAVLASVTEFHHTIDTSNLKYEFLRVRDELSTQISTQVGKHASGLKNAFLDAKQQLYYTAPVLSAAEEAARKGLISLHRGTKANLLTMHRFIKENEMLCDEYHF